MVQEAIPLKIQSGMKYFVWENIDRKRNLGSGIFSKYLVKKVEFGNNYSGYVISGEVSFPTVSNLTVISLHAPLEDPYSIIPLHRIFSADKLVS